MDEIKERLLKSPFVTKQIRDDVQSILSYCKRLEEGIEELLAYGMPSHIEEGLRKLMEKE